MKRNPKKIALMGLAASVVFGASACGASREPNVYGPPVTTEMTTDENEISAVYGPPSTEMTTDENEIPTVYGPPSTEITTEQNEMPDVYGPPSTEITTEQNELPDVYGPPEWFEEEE